VFQQLLAAGFQNMTHHAYISTIAFTCPQHLVHTAPRLLRASSNTIYQVEHSSSITLAIYDSKDNVCSYLDSAHTIKDIFCLADDAELRIIESVCGVVQVEASLPTADFLMHKYQAFIQDSILDSTARQDMTLHVSLFARPLLVRFCARESFSDIASALAVDAKTKQHMLACVPLETGVAAVIVSSVQGMNTLLHHEILLPNASVLAFQTPPAVESD
jgi:hypothetical protein